MRGIFSIVLVIIGALIGAGFASGQEIYSFFYCYGINGLFGIAVTCTLISVLIFKSFKIICKNQINSYEEFLAIFIRNKKITKIISLILNILLLASFYIMIAGFGAYFEQEIGINKIIGSLILVIMCFVVFLTNVKGVLKVSEYLVPILIVFIVIIGVNNLCTIDLRNIQIPIIKKGWLLSSIIYCSYNVILLIPVLISLRKHISKEENIKYIAIISNIIIIVLSSMIYMILIKSDVEISTLEMPAVYIIRKFFPKLKNIYAFIILSSIFTTAISIGIGLLQNISKDKKSYTQLVTFMCITSLIISNFGFSKLLNFAYPVFGYLGIAQILCIINAKT